MQTTQAKRAADNGFEFSVAAAAATTQHRQLALAVVIATLLAYAVIVANATIQLPRIDSFIPSVSAIIFVTDLVTAVLLFGQYSTTGSRALLVLATGYLFSSVIVIVRGLTFPGAFAPGGVSAGAEASIWLDNFWRLGLALAALGYAILASRKHTKDASDPSPRTAIFWSLMIVVAVVGALSWVAIAGLPPRLLVDGKAMPLNDTINGGIALTSSLTLLLLLARGRSVLDLWLMVAVFAMLAESAVIAFLVSPRFSLAFYAMRLVALPISKAVLIALLWETMRLYADLSISNRELRRERANRLTSAEAVVASIAHEIRQPLTDMNLQAFAGQKLLDRAPPDVGGVKQILEEIEEGAFRANEVFDGFLRFFRGGKPDRQAVDVNALTLESTHLLRKDLDDHDVTINTQLASDLPVVYGHAGQLREVILNLIQNSIDAMASTTDRPRAISITTARLGAGAVAISLQDTGPGIEPEGLASIFEPFATTKTQGTGLGLAICKMIVEQHGGELSAASGENGGARFEITLPTRPSAPARAASDKERGGRFQTIR